MTFAKSKKSMLDRFYFATNLMVHSLNIDRLNLSTKVENKSTQFEKTASL